MDAVSTALSWLSLRHAAVYSFITKQYVVVRLAFLTVFTAINLFIALPFAAWLTAGISGDFVWTSSLSLWEMAWAMRVSYYDILCVCGHTAHCGCNAYDYTPTFFFRLFGYPNSRTLHALFAVYVSLTTLYQASLTISLVYGLPYYRPVRSIALLYGLFSYAVALWYLGLGDGIDRDKPYGFISLWCLTAALGCCLAWLARHHRCEQ